MSPTLALITALALPPNASATIEGTVQTSFDGSRFGAREVFDFEAGGLRVERVDGARVTVKAGGVGAACAAANVASPCLVPRLEELAHARLMSVEELRASLKGDLALSIHVPPPPPSRTPWVVLGLALLAAAFTGAMAWFDRARSSLLGRVLAAASAARRATASDPTLRVVHEEIERMVEHARDVERIRLSCLESLSKARAMPGERLAVEREEERRVEDDLRRAQTRLGEIAAAMRLVPLRVREARDVRFGPSPVESIVAELSLRDRAVTEASRL